MVFIDNMMFVFILSSQDLTVGLISEAPWRAKLDMSIGPQNYYDWLFRRLYG